MNPAAKAEDGPKILRRKTTSLPCPPRFSDIRSFESMGPLLEDITERLGVGLCMSRAEEPPFFTSPAYSRLSCSHGQLNEDLILLESGPVRFQLRLLSSYDHDQTMGRLAQMALLGEIFVGLAHDFNNVLTVISGNMGFLEEMLKVPTEPDEIEAVDSAVKDIHSAIEMGKELCNRAQFLGSQKQAKEPRRENLKEITASAIRMAEVKCARERAGGKDVTVENHFNNPLFATVVASELHMAVLNILFNAIRHSGGEGKPPRVTVDAFLLNDRVNIAVSNNGPPIPDELKESLFQKPLTSCCVHGYGLYVAARNIAPFGGRIAFDSDETETTFVISVPLTREHRASG
ncbi:MAG TPA: HAMP domain-containing sensor histidine kinase [Candidatus Bilamarchaeum sp.]|nr:HAMP domain-containing sensor histidine kinase [Candidatus Bilamarchaeum sp.]